MERERGITVKAQTVSMIYSDDDGEDYLVCMSNRPEIPLLINERTIKNTYLQLNHVQQYQ